MKTSIISIGNSKSVQLSRATIEASGLTGEVKLVVKHNEIKLTPSASRRRTAKVSEAAILSEAAFAKDWLRPEEDEAWAAYQ